LWKSGNLGAFFFPQINPLFGSHWINSIPFTPKKIKKWTRFSGLYFILFCLFLSLSGVGGETLVETNLRAFSAAISMWSCTVKMDEENPTCTGLTQENSFGSASSCMLPCMVRGTGALCTSRKECNKYDLTAPQCFWLAHQNVWSMWFVPVSVLFVGSQKST